MISWEEYVGPTPYCQTQSLAETRELITPNVHQKWINYGFQNETGQGDGFTRETKATYYYITSGNRVVTRINGYDLGTSTSSSMVSGGSTIDQTYTVAKVTSAEVPATFSDYSYSFDEYDYYFFPITVTLSRQSVKTTQIQTTKSVFTTTSTNNTTQFSTASKNISIFTTTLGNPESYTVQGTTTNGVITISRCGAVFNTVVQAGEGEVLYVVQQGDLTFWQPQDTPFLTEIATTATRITVSWRASSTTASPIQKASNQLVTNTIDSIEVTSTYRASKLIYNSAISSSGYAWKRLQFIPADIVPTPTTFTKYRNDGKTTTESTYAAYFNYTTTQSTYTAFARYPEANLKSYDITLFCEKKEKLPKIIQVNITDSTMLTYDEIIQAGATSFVINGHPNNNIAIEVTGESTESPPADTFAREIRAGGNSYNILVDKDPGSPYALAGGYYGDIPANTAAFQAVLAYKLGYMTSPTAYAGGLSVSDITITTRTIIQTTSSSNPFSSSSVTTTTTIGDNSATTTTFKTTTTTASPSYAYFHRYGGGMALMPTSGESTAYTAELTAVTYTTTTVESSSSTTTSKIVSAVGSGITKTEGRSLLGGGAGFEETIFGKIFGKVKVNGTKTFFANDASFSSTTDSSFVASRIELPALAMTAATALNAGPFYYLGSYSYLEILDS